jgi:transposase
LGEIGDVNRFAELEKLVAYAGIDPTVLESGQFGAMKAHMSKRGSSYLRRALCRKLLARIYVILQEERPYVVP